MPGSRGLLLVPMSSLEGRQRAPTPRLVLHLPRSQSHSTPGLEALCLSLSGLPEPPPHGPSWPFALPKRGAGCPGLCLHHFTLERVTGSSISPPQMPTLHLCQERGPWVRSKVTGGLHHCQRGPGAFALPTGVAALSVHICPEWRMGGSPEGVGFLDTAVLTTESLLHR